MGYTISMNKKAVINRLRRSAGQLTKLADAIETEEPCSAVLIQLLAVRGAVNGVIKEYVALSVDECGKKTQPAEMAELLKFIINKA